MAEPFNKASKSEKEQSKLFFSLFMRNQTRIYSYILMLVPNRTYADEIMQDVSALLWEKFDTFELGTNFAAWGVRIAHFEILSFYRKQENKKVIFDSELVDMLSVRAKSRFTHVDKQIAALRKCLNKLNDTDRQLIKLHYEDNFTIRDISSHIDKSIHALYKVFNRIHHFLLKCVHRTIKAEETIW